ncbi:MAG: GTP cyclohydrolase I FolE [Planctomycetota bacterium]|jgi:GTP cyclohydrolase I
MAAKREYDPERFEAAVREMLAAMGEDPKRPGLKGTPRRVAEMYGELLAGMRAQPSEILRSLDGDKHDEIVLVRDIPLYSLCEHHLLPFVGRAHVAYVPKGKMVGLSKIARVVECYARRLQVQERLTTQVADALMKALSPKGVLVVVEAEHLCMTMRGVEKPGAVTTTSVVRGLFRRNPASRAEALSLMFRPR